MSSCQHEEDTDVLLEESLWIGGEGDDLDTQMRAGADYIVTCIRRSFMEDRYSKVIIIGNFQVNQKVLFLVRGSILHFQLAFGISWRKMTANIA